MRSQQKANLVEPYRETLIEVDARADQKTGFAAIAVAYGIRPVSLESVDVI